MRDMAPYLALPGVASILVMLQPDMGTIMVAIAAAGITLFAAGARPRDLVLLLAGLSAATLVMAIAAPLPQAAPAHLS